MTGRRDPRLEPKPGDRVCVNGRIRRVTGIIDNQVHYTTEQATAQAKAVVLKTWRKWASAGYAMRGAVTP